VRYVVKLPKLGDTTDVVTIARWYINPGEAVEPGDALVGVETDKVEIDVPAPVSGILTERLVSDGDEVATGAPIAIVESRSAARQDAAK
jgi:pyruvate/2-oxoglutarate dehydrogenase complex dihydrolipoamide acyltransferase (E2) component